MEKEGDSNILDQSLTTDDLGLRTIKRNKKPSAKGRRDDAIQGTNDSSIVSKRSVERTGYDIKSAQHQWLRNFVKKPIRRAPLINLGYFVRIKAVERVVDKFLAEPGSQKKIIVNLGCGYDPLPFIYISSTSDAVFVDVDFPDLIQHKCNIIRETAALSEVFGNEFGGTSGEIRTKNYYAIGCDLSNLSLFDTSLRSIDPDIERASILFISEVAITYMPTIAADSLISFTSKFSQASFAILEQITPAGPAHPFAATMQKHFNKLTTPLLSLSQYPTLRSQARRFLEAGYAEVEACDLNTFFYGVMPNEDRIKALKMEPFDEYEELGTFLGHYFILVARNQTGKHYLRSKGHDWQYINWKKDMLLNGIIISSDHSHVSKPVEDRWSLYPLNEENSLRRRFPAVASRKSGFLIHGGLSSTTRLSTLLQLSPANQSSTLETSLMRPAARMCHTLTSLGDGRVLLVGGRDAPDVAMNDVWVFDGEWRQVESLPHGIYRHSAVQIGVNRVVIFGGRRNAGVSTDWWLYTHYQGWHKLTCDGSCPALWGASLGWNHHQGVLIGGMDEDGECGGDIFLWYLDEKSFRVELHKLRLPANSRSLTRRYGAKVVSQGPEFFVIGGAGSHHVLPWSEQFILLSAMRETVESIDVSNTLGVEPWLIGHDVAIQESTRDIIIVGGGGVCFSFGSFWNDTVFHLHQGNSIFSPQHWALVDETHSRTDSKSSTIRTLDNPMPIRRVQISTPEEWHQIVASSTVCVIEALDFGSCIKKWTPEYLKLRVGEKQVIIHSTHAEAMNFLAKNFKYATRSFSDFIDTVFSTTDEKIYLRAVSEDAKNKPARLEDDFPTLANDFKIPTILCGPGGIDLDRVFSTVLRIGGVGTSMWLHYDVMANILTQIVGEKEILIFHPSMVNELDIPSGASSSRVADIFSSQLLYKGFSTILKPGDVLYIPPLWPHATKPLTPNIGVNVFWKSFRDEAYDRGKDIYGNKDLVGYTEGRKLIERIARGFKDVDSDTRGFYIKRLISELGELLE